jgi:structural maintenance of chromosome 3 (chondroitin sulfate proteoglycan 6)
LRRTIGLKKDEYSLDKKVVTKSEVMNLLESAGFSRSNPYYIVPQGRITSLVASKENERLLLLKEVAGTQVYEQRRLESVKIMQETNQKRSQIADLLEYIDERLVELEEEKKELDLYLEIDKDRRCLEYALYTKDQSDAIDQLEAIEIKRQEEQHEAIVRYKQLSDRQVMIQENMQELNAKKTELELKLIEKQQIQDDISENVSKRAKILLQIKDFTENLDSTATSRVF